MPGDGQKNLPVFDAFYAWIHPEEPSEPVTSPA